MCEMYTLPQSNIAFKVGPFVPSNRSIPIDFNIASSLVQARVTFAISQKGTFKFLAYTFCRQPISSIEPSELKQGRFYT